MNNIIEVNSAIYINDGCGHIMHCPYCGEELEHLISMDDVHIFHCANSRCHRTKGIQASPEAWRRIAYQEEAL